MSLNIAQSLFRVKLHKFYNLSLWEALPPSLLSILFGKKKNLRSMKESSGIVVHRSGEVMETDPRDDSSSRSTACCFSSWRVLTKRDHSSILGLAVFWKRKNLILIYIFNIYINKTSYQGSNGAEIFLQLYVIPQLHRKYEFFRRHHRQQCWSRCCATYSD